MSQDYITQLNEKVSSLIVKQSLDHLKDIVDMRRDGPVIVCKEDISHYEAIGLILYSMKGYQASSKEIKFSLSESGRKVIVPARLHEMVKKGHLFKPVAKGSFYKLTTKGLNWVEKDVLPSIREKLSS